jgi:hypothetical protein
MLARSGARALRLAVSPPQRCAAARRVSAVARHVAPLAAAPSLRAGRAARLVRVRAVRLTRAGRVVTPAACCCCWHRSTATRHHA